MFAYNGTLDILSGSVVTGIQNGISVEVDDRYSSSVYIIINNSYLTGQNGCATGWTMTVSLLPYR